MRLLCIYAVTQPSTYLPDYPDDDYQIGAGRSRTGSWTSDPQDVGSVAEAMTAESDRVPAGTPMVAY